MANHVSFLLDQLAEIDYTRTPNRLALYSDIKRKTRMRLASQHVPVPQIDATIRNIDYAVGQIEENFDSYRAYFVDDAVFDGYQYGAGWRKDPPARARRSRYQPVVAEPRRAKRRRGGFLRGLGKVAAGIVGIVILGGAAAGSLHLYRVYEPFASREPTVQTVSTNDSFGEIAIFFERYGQRLEEFRSRSRNDVYPISGKFIAYNDLEDFVGRNLNSAFEMTGEAADLSGNLRYMSEDGRGYKLIAVNTGICSPLMLVRPELADPRRSNKPYDCTAFGIWTEAGAGY